jgi:hypothetical protein
MMKYWLMLYLCFPITVFAADETPALKSSTPTFSKALEEIAQNQKFVHTELEKARQVKSVPVFSCMDKKAQLIDRLALSANRIAASQSNESKQIENQLERLTSTNDSVKKLVPLTMRCWCEDQDALSQYISLGSGEKSGNLSNMCQDSINKPETVVTLKNPDDSDDIDTSEIESTNLEGNYGFPEIPVASPFR